ncbi:putative sodium/potassium/calcium exchanger [Orchesella cincta]|uniref:Putative sodium/potassium/calcium exchanger n=1 Tax=Orchesella cincta TaxID=48709 RepID=A0A1D2MM97_ORCCI|nr:putative sodium/potassium/calcium exchanger [Orchesella cincta]
MNSVKWVDDIGVSGVIGSAVFNIMFVISICSLLTPTVLYLNWWPMFRDCFFYMISIFALLITILDEEIEWSDQPRFISFQFVLEAWAHTLPIPFPVIHVPVPDENSGLVTYKAKSDHGATTSALGGGENIVVEGLDPTLSSGMGNTYGDVWDGGMGGTTQQMGNAATGQYPEGGGVGGGGGELDPPNKVAPQPESILQHLNPPSESSLPKRLLWKISSPLIYLFYYTVPDCRLEAWKSWYLVTFIVSLVWIAIFSYVMVWMITVVGFTAGVPDTVMGLTFVAAGVSVPDALSSLAVVKEGFGDMAVSNAIGSNVFDILICLGLPWFLSTVIVHPGVPVKVISKGLTYSTFSLFSTVAFLLLATHYNGWKLDKRYGILLMLWYIFFMVFASLYELNVFGNFNPPECESDY